MKVILELHKRSKDENAEHPIVVRFIVDRKTIRYYTGINISIKDWIKEQRSGYTHLKEAVELEEKAKVILQDTMVFDFDKFKKQMKEPLVSKDALSKWWSEYQSVRTERLKKNNLSWRTFELDQCVYKKFDKFLSVFPEVDDIHAWKKDQLEEFHYFMTHDEKLSGDTAKIYLEAFRTFFTWLRDEKEVITHSPFSKYKIQKGDSSWYPYSLKELITILSVKPESVGEHEALRWVKLFLSFGGADPMDFSAMKWKQVQYDAIQMLRVKVRKSSKTGKKIVYLNSTIRTLFVELSNERGENEDFILPVFRKENTQKQNIERHKLFIRKINKYMKKMLLKHYLESKTVEGNSENPLINFTIKRLRPTAATIALMSSGGDVDFVSKLLMHSNLAQTTIYLANLPNEEMKKNQEKYNDAIQAVLS